MKLCKDCNINEVRADNCRFCRECQRKKLLSYRKTFPICLKCRADKLNNRAPYCRECARKSESMYRDQKKSLLNIQSMDKTPILNFIKEVDSKAGYCGLIELNKLINLYEEIWYDTDSITYEDMYFRLRKLVKK